MAASTLFDLPEHVAAEILPFLELKDFVRLDTATSVIAHRPQLASLYQLHCIHDKISISDVGLSWVCRKGIELRDVELNSKDLSNQVIGDTEIQLSRPNLLAKCLVHFIIDRKFVDGAASLIKQLLFPLKKLTVDFIFSCYDDRSFTTNVMMPLENSLADCLIFRQTFVGITEDESDSPAVLHGIANAQHANTIAHSLLRGFGSNYLEHIMDSSMLQNKPCSSLLHAEVDLMEKYPLLETVVQNADKLLTLSAKGPNCGYLMQIQSTVLQELSLRFVCYGAWNDDPYTPTTALPPSFVQWIAHQAPFRYSLQTIHLANMAKDVFPSHHYRCLSSLPQLRSLSLESVEYDAADIEYLLDHAPTGLHSRVSLICNLSTCSFCERLLTQNKYEAVAIACKGENLATEMNAFQSQSIASKENGGLLPIQSRLRELKITLAYRTKGDEYLFTMIQGGMFRHLEVLELRGFEINVQRLQMIAAHCPLLQDLTLGYSGYFGFGTLDDPLTVYLSSFPQGWRKLRSVRMVDCSPAIIFPVEGIESVLTCSPIVRNVELPTTAEVTSDMELRARLKEQYPIVELRLKGL